MAKNKKRADGRYSCQVYLGKGPDGKRKYKTFCTLMYFAGVDVMTARDQMGHKDISVTLGIYTALDKKFKKKKINRLDTYLKKSCTQSG